MTEDGQPLDQEDYAMMSNAGRCDICGQTIDMKDSGDTLSIAEFDVDDEITEEHGVTDQDAADGVADALESVGTSGADYDLADTIREKHAIKVHDECLTEKTEYDRLTVPVEEVQEYE